MATKFYSGYMGPSCHICDLSFCQGHVGTDPSAFATSWESNTHMGDNLSMDTRLSYQ